MALGMSHYSIQEVEQRPGVHGYQATGPILPDRLRGKRRQAGRQGRGKREEGGSKAGEGREGSEGLVGGVSRRGGGVSVGRICRTRNETDTGNRRLPCVYFTVMGAEPPKCATSGQIVTSLSPCVPRRLLLLLRLPSS